MQRGQLDMSIVVPIAGDGAIGHPDVADGRIIPVLIVDCSNHNNLYEFILLQESTPPGDVSVTWGRERFNKRAVYLTIAFHRPIATKAVFRFAIPAQAGLVDGIIHSRGVYLQPLQSGKSVSEGIDGPKIVVEVPPAATFDEWPEIHHAAIVRDYRRQGAPKKIARALADEHLLRISEIWRKRQRTT